MRERGCRGVQLTTLFGTAADVVVDAALWGAAAYLGGLRTASNDARRRVDQDRGSLGNLVVDLQGVLGELIVLRASTSLDGWTAHHTLFDAAGGGSAAVSSAVDVALSAPQQMVTARTLRGQRLPDVSCPAREFRLEAKCHLDLSQALIDAGQRRKMDFAVNRKAVLDSVAVGADAVVCVVATPGHGVAVRGRMLPIADVFEWEVVDYRADNLALRMPLGELSPIVWDAPWPAVRERVHASPEVISLGLLSEAHAAGRADYADWARDQNELPAEADAAVAILAEAAGDGMRRRRKARDAER